MPRPIDKLKRRSPGRWTGSPDGPGRQRDEDEQQAYTNLLTAIGDYRRRHHRAGPDIFGPRTQGLDGDEWDHLTDAIDLYTHARVRYCLEQLSQRTTAERATQPSAPAGRRDCASPWRVAACSACSSRSSARPFIREEAPDL
ncbi:hypothetical protein [Streptomyces sp. NPDC047869]|uniref:hypothetical protein n=1 Tax=Streptomyces sp. NPDC047869 TaxID=3154709 RepID=UPI00345690AA